MSRDCTASWLADGHAAFRRMLEAIAGARRSVRFETYIFAAGTPGDDFRAGLAAAAARGVGVRVLVDGFGSRALPENYWEPLLRAGGQARVFNPLALGCIAIRDHRKLVVVDDEVAFVGGFNIAPEYAGNGVTQGWFDLGMELHGDVAGELASTFDVMFAQHEPGRRRFARWHLQRASRPQGGGAILATGPGIGRNRFHHQLLRDLAGARRILIVAAYFVPGLRLRRTLRAVSRRGGDVRLLLPSQSDVPLALAAARSFYLRLLRARVRIAEYQPQILHAKAVIVDDVVFVGSANLDARSFAINYELVVRLEDPALAAAGRTLLDAAWERSALVDLRSWSRGRTWWARLREKLAKFLLTRVDVWFARRQWRRSG